MGNIIGLSEEAKEFLTGPWNRCPHSVHVTSRQLLCMQAETLGNSLKGPGRCKWADAVFWVRCGAPSEGDMSFTLQTKKNILSAAMIAVLLFAAGSLARATVQPRVASVNRPSGTITVGKIEIPRCWSRDKGARRFQCRYTSTGSWAHPGYRFSRSLRQRGPCGPSGYLLSSLAKDQGRRRDSIFHRGWYVQISSCFSPCCSSQCHRGLK